MTMTEFVGSLGSKSCESQAKNTSALIVRVNNVAVSKQEANNAPMTLVRPLAMPIVFANTTLPNRCVAMRTRHIVCKTAFITINNGLASRLIAFYLVLKEASCLFVRFRRRQCFFYS